MIRGRLLGQRLSLCYIWFVICVFASLKGRAVFIYFYVLTLTSPTPRKKRIRNKLKDLPNQHIHNRLPLLWAKPALLPGVEVITAVRRLCGRFSLKILTVVPRPFSTPLGVAYIQTQLFCHRFTSLTVQVLSFRLLKEQWRLCVSDFYSGNVTAAGYSVHLDLVQNAQQKSLVMCGD